jgi:hypothetical protein
MGPRRPALAALTLGLAAAAAAAAPPAVLLSPGTAVGELPRIGVNLGGRTVWGAEQLMANVLRNPGFESVLDGALIVAADVQGAGVLDDSRWTARPPGFWAGASYEVLSGPATGRRGRVADNRRSSNQVADALMLDPPVPTLRPGDVLAVQGLQDATAAPLWWTQGRVQAAAEARPGSPGRRSVRLTAGAGQSASALHFLDNIGARAGKLLPVNGKWRLAVWLRASQPGTRVRLSFGRQGRPAWLDEVRTMEAGPGWRLEELTFDTQDDGPAGPLQLAITCESGEVLLDDVELGAAGAAQAGGFRAEVVGTLRAMRPGYLRDWQGQLADTPDNRAAGALARHPIRYRPGENEVQFAYGLDEFLALAADVGARPWVVLPSTSTPAQARAFGALLRRAWQRHHFDEIVVEHGNEHWNSIFRPAGIAQARVLAEVADRAFAALRQGAGPEVPLHRVIGTLYVDGAAAGRMMNLSRQSEGVAVAPYFLYRQEAGESTDAALDRALREDIAPLRQALAAAAAAKRSVDVYEVNFHTTAGSASAAERDAVVTAPAAGAALMRRLLQSATAGVQRQAVYALAGYDTFTDGEPRQLTQLFGITRDLATAANWRPTGAAVQALNRVLGGMAYRATCSGAACADITALSLGCGTRWAIVSAAAQPVTASWSCSTEQQLRLSTGETRRAPCTGGQATLTLPARSWVTAAPP